MESTAQNYNSNADLPLLVGECLYPGCLRSDAKNFDDSANVRRSGPDPGPGPSLSTKAWPKPKVALTLQVLRAGTGPSTGPGPK